MDWQNNPLKLLYTDNVKTINVDKKPRRGRVACGKVSMCDKRPRRGRTTSLLMFALSEDDICWPLSIRRFHSLRSFHQRLSMVVPLRGTSTVGSGTPLSCLYFGYCDPDLPVPFHDTYVMALQYAAFRVPKCGILARENMVFGLRNAAFCNVLITKWLYRDDKKAIGLCSNDLFYYHYMVLNLLLYGLDFTVIRA